MGKDKTRPSLKPFNEWQEELSVGKKHTVIQRGDIVLVSGEDVSDIPGVVGAMVSVATRSHFYHAIIYDRGWRFIHAEIPKVESDNLDAAYFGKSKIALTWVRPRRPDSRPIPAADTGKVIQFAEEQIGKPYDFLATISFVMRSDGLAEIHLPLRKYFRYRNWLQDDDKWYCSELAGAAWYNGAGVIFVDETKNKTYLSPADIYDSLYQDVVCTLKVHEGKFILLTKASLEKPT